MYKKESDKGDFTHDVANANSKDLSKRTVSDKVLKGKAHEIELNTKYDAYQRGLASMVYKSFWWENRIRRYKQNESKFIWSTISRIIQTSD